MARELRELEVSEIPELRRVAREVRESNEPRLLVEENEQLAVIVPIEQLPKKVRKTGILTREDPLFRMIGSSRSNIPGGISGRKHEFFKEAFDRRG